jgi:hypothetical protein
MCLAGRASKDVSCRTDVFSIGASKNKLHKSCRKDAFSRGASKDKSCGKDVFSGGASKDKSCGKDVFSGARLQGCVMQDRCV